MTKLNDQSAIVTGADVGLCRACAVALTDVRVYLALCELIEEVLELLRSYRSVRELWDDL